MKRHPTTDGIVWFEPDEVMEMIRERLRAEGVQHDPIGLQIKVQQPFEGGSCIHNEVPSLTVILSNAGL